MGDKKQTIKNAKSKEYYVVRNNSGNITNIIFPNTTQFGLDNSLSASVVFSVDAIPDQDAVRSLGSSAKQWKDLYVSEGTIFLGGARISLSDGGKVQIRDQGTETDVVISDIDGGTVDNASVISAIGFTPARVDLGNVTGATGRAALGISDHTTGSISDLFGNLTPSFVTTGLGFTPININLSNAPSTILNSSVTKSTLGLGNVENKTAATIIGEITSGDITGPLGYSPVDPSNPPSNLLNSNVTRSTLGISDHVTGSISDLFDNLTAGRVTTSLGFTPAQNDLGNVTGATGRSALGISDHVTGSLTDIFNNAPASLRNSNITLIKSGGTLTFNNGSGNSSLAFAKGDVGLGNVENKSSSTIRGEITSGDVTGPLGYTPVDPSNPPSNLLNSNVTRSTLGISDHVTGSISDLFDNLSSSKITAGLGFTPIDVTLSNAPSTILNSNVTKTSIGLGNVENKSSSTIRGEITTGDITGPLGYTPLDVALSNAPSTILNSNVTRSSLGIQDHTTGSLSELFTAASLSRSATTAALLSAGTSTTPVTADVDHTNIEVISGHSGTTLTHQHKILVAKGITVGAPFNSTSYYFPSNCDVTIDNNNDIGGARYIGAGGVTSPSSPMTIEGNTSTHYNGSNGRQGILYVKNTDTSMEDTDAIVNLESSDSSMGNQNYWISFRQGSTIVGSINSSVAYSTFTGQHTSILSGSVPKQGSILSSTGNILHREGISNAWVETAVTTTSNQKNVIGVFDSVYEDVTPISHLSGSGYQCMYNALGEGQILVTDENGNIENGDYICSSNKKGHGMKQNSDSLKNYTVAKATESIDFAEVDIDDTLGFKSKLVACTYHCG